MFNLKVTDGSVFSIFKNVSDGEFKEGQIIDYRGCNLKVLSISQPMYRSIYGREVYELKVMKE